MLAFAYEDGQNPYGLNKLEIISSTNLPRFSGNENDAPNLSKKQSQHSRLGSLTDRRSQSERKDNERRKKPSYFSGQSKEFDSPMKHNMFFTDMITVSGDRKGSLANASEGK